MFVTIISPAKKLDYSPVEKNLDSTDTKSSEHSNELIKDLKSLNPQEVSSLMGLSDKLGALNYERFQEWETPFTESNSKQAILAFKGDVYQGLDAESLSETELIWAQKQCSNIIRAIWDFETYGLNATLSPRDGYKVRNETRTKSL